MTAQLLSLPSKCTFHKGWVHQGVCSRLLEHVAMPKCMTALPCCADSPDFKPRVNWSRFHETMPLADMAQDPYAMSPTAMKTNVTSLTSTDGVNGPADISGAVPLAAVATVLSGAHRKL